MKWSTDVTWFNRFLSTLGDQIGQTKPTLDIYCLIANNRELETFILNTQRIVWEKKNLRCSCLPSWHLWIQVSNSAVCSVILTYEHGFLETLLDFWQTWRPFFSFKQCMLKLCFIFSDGIWSELLICTATLIREHQWGNNTL